MSDVTWRVTRPLKAKDITCDLCGKPADSLHFIPVIVRPEHVVFACTDHCPVPDGYWVDLDRWFADPEHWDRHIAMKRDGDVALGMLHDRFEEVRQKLAAA